MSLLENVRKQCKEQQITIDQLEKAAGLAMNSIYRWGRISPSIDKVQRVARTLNVTVDKLLNERENVDRVGVVQGR